MCECNDGCLKDCDIHYIGRMYFLLFVHYI